MAYTEISIQKQMRDMMLSELNKGCLANVYKAKDVNDQEGNTVRAGILYCPVQEGTRVITPAIWMDNIDLSRGLAECVEAARKTLTSAVEDIRQDARMLRFMDKIKNDKEFALSHLTIKILDPNVKGLTAATPHIDWNGLYVVGYIVEDGALENPGEKGFMSTLLTNHLSEHLGIDGKEAIKDALKKCQETQPLSIISMDSMIADMMAENDVEYKPDELTPPMYIISNPSKMFGAAVIAYEGTLEKIEEIFPGGFYILPSSVHELIVTPVVRRDEQERDEILSMVYDVNRTHVDLIDRLSDNAWMHVKEGGTWATKMLSARCA